MRPLCLKPLLALTVLMLAVARPTSAGTHLLSCGSADACAGVGGVVVQIGLDASVDLATLGFRVSYDTSVLDAVDYRKAGRTVPDPQVSGIDDGAGVVIFAFGDLTGGAAIPAGSGPIAEIVFDVAADAEPGSYPLTVADVREVLTTQFVDVTADVTSADGQFGVVLPNIIVTPAATTVAEGKMATLSVAVSREIALDLAVEVAVAVGSDPDFHVRPALLRFTAADWTTHQLVTVTARQDDDVCNGGGDVELTCPGCDTGTVTAAVTEVDDDVQRLLVAPSSIRVREGGSKTFTVVLAHRPCDDVTVTIDTEGGDPDLQPDPDPTSLIFTPDNWDVPQSVAIAAQEDTDVCDGEATVLVSSPGLEDATLLATETDNDEQRFLFDPETITVPEGGVATFTVALALEPCGALDVTVANAGGDVDVQPETTFLTFSPVDYQVPQTVVVTAAEDLDVCDGSARLRVAWSEGDKAAVVASEADNDRQRLVVTPLGVAVPEGLARQALPYHEAFTADGPDASAGWECYSSDDRHGRIRVVGERLRMDVKRTGFYSLNEATLHLRAAGATGLRLRFFQAEFREEQHWLPSRFAGHHDGDGVAISSDGATWYTILSAGALDVGPSGRMFDVDLDAEADRIRRTYDATFAYTHDFQIKFQQYDDSSHDTDGREWDDVDVTASHIEPLSSDDVFSVALAYDPCGAVAVTVSNVAGDPDLRPSPASSLLTFTPEEWDASQPVVVAAADDVDVCHGQATLRIETESADPVEVAATEIDKDTLQVVVTPDAISVPEGGSGTFTVVMAAQPCEALTVTIANAAGDPDLQPAVDSRTLVFTVDDWDIVRLLTVNAADDDDVCNGTATFRVSAAGASHTDLLVAEQDDDAEAQSLVVEPAALGVPASDCETFTVALAHEPCDDVTVTIEVRGTCVTATPDQLVFAPDGHGAPQTVTVCGIQDEDACDCSETIRVKALGMTNADVAVVVEDADPQGFVIETKPATDPPAMFVAEGEASTFTVALAYRPCKDATITVTVENADGDLDLQPEPDPTLLVFTADDWRRPKTVTVAAAEDDDPCDDLATIRVSAAGIPEAVVTATERDNDKPTILAEPAELFVLEGGANYFAVVLSGAPCVDVTIDVNRREGSDESLQATPTALTFTPENWSVPQTVTVTADEDDDAEDDRARFRLESAHYLDQWTRVVARALEREWQDDFETGNFSRYPWTAHGRADWRVDPREGHDSEHAARSGRIGHKRESVLALTREVAEGELHFYVKTSTHRRDKLIFSIDGQTKARWSGNRARWREAAYHVPAGLHTFTWTYRKDKRRTRAKDAVWIDDVHFIPD